MTGDTGSRDGLDTPGMAARVHNYDWASTALGPYEDWPQSLKTAVRIMLTSRYAMWMLWGPDLTFFCNDAYLPTLGVKGDWALGARSDDVWREIWPDVGPRIDRVLAVGEATWDEGLFLLLQRRGFIEETYHTFSYSPLTDDEGMIAGMLCVVTEETERVIGQRRLVFLSKLAAGVASVQTRSAVCEAMTACLDATPHDLPFVLVYILDEGGRSARLASASGLSSDHRAAPPSLDITDVSAWPLAEAASEAIRIDDLAARFGDLSCKPWDQAPTRALVLPIVTRTPGRAIGSIVVGLNPYRPLDAAYQDFIDLFIAQLVSGFAGADAYEAERQRADRLAELDRAKTAFFSNISHEFRTPLTLMLSPLEEALAKPDGVFAAADRALIDMAHRNGLRLLRLVNGLLDFSRVEAGRVNVRFEPTDLSSFTAQIAGNFRSLCNQAGLALNVDCRPLPSLVAVDREMWEKVVLNLLSNAFKFTFTGAVSVVLRAEGENAVLDVIDTGIGIPSHEVPRLFERFHRVEGAHGRTYEGSGIGLALVDELVRLHDGAIRVASEPDRGSTFTVILPLAGRRQAASEPATPPAAFSTAVRADAFVEEARRWLDNRSDAEAVDGSLDKDVSGKVDPDRGDRILLADDNADMRDHIRRLLESQGYRVDAVSDGREALAALKHRPDLVLSDVMMPHIDGFALLKAIRGDSAFQDLPVVLLSARAGEEAKVEGLDAGADDYLTKPFAARELLARVGSNLKLARVRRQAALDLRRANEELVALTRSLEDKVDARTRALTASVTRFRGSFDASPDFMHLFSLTADDQVIYQDLNPAAADRFKQRPDDVLGRTAIEVFDADTSDTIVRCARECWRTGEVQRYEAVRTLGAEEPFTLSVWAAPIGTNEAGERLVLFCGRDITDQRRAEEQLRQAQKMEAVGQLTGGLAHDFNNLLTGIIGGLDMLKRRVEQGRTDGIERYIDAAQGAASRAASLTHRLLAFSRRQTLEPKPTDIAHLAAGMRDLIDRTVGPEIAVELRSGAAVWPTLVDPSQLENALLNLCINARDAMPDGGRIVIETKNKPLGSPGADARDLSPGDYVSLSVADCGTGIAPEIIPRIFDPFFTTKPLGMGTGLGLSMIYGFVRQSGGQVRVQSQIGAGTTITILLPKHAGLVPDKDAAVPLETPRAYAGETVLVIDDEPTVRMLILEVLVDLGYATVEAKDGTAGLKILRSNARIDLLVTDVGLPGGMNGRQVADAARVLRPNLKVLFITGYAENAVFGEGSLEEGMHIMTKPFELEHLATRIKHLLAKQ